MSHIENHTSLQLKRPNCYANDGKEKLSGVSEFIFCSSRADIVYDMLKVRIWIPKPKNSRQEACK